VSEIFEARRRAARLGRLLRIGLGLLVVVATGAAFWAIWFSSALAIQTVRVAGVTTIPAQSVVAAAGVELGRPLARIDVEAVRSRVAKLRRVDHAEVSRSWPHTLTITIHERMAVAWSFHDGRVRGVDRHGIEFRQYSRRPKLVEVRAGAFDADTRRRALASLGKVVVDLRRGYPELLAISDYVDADTRDSIELHLSRGRLVVWGSATKADQKIAALRVLLRAVKAHRYDVSVPEQPTTAN
jgi:cell division protein FtsQ